MISSPDVASVQGRIFRIHKVGYNYDQSNGHGTNIQRERYKNAWITKIGQLLIDFCYIFALPLNALCAMLLIFAGGPCLSVLISEILAIKWH